VLDVGCGTGIHSIGYAVVGVKSYTGIDPVIQLDSDRANNLRKRDWESFGWTPQQIMNQFGRIRLVPGTFEAFRSGETFDIAVLHNVTEHLFQIDEVLRSTANCLRGDGALLFHHHNFYCWNGHHLQPKTIDKIDLNDPEQKKYIDWAHIRYDAPDGHFFHRGLNKIRLEKLRELVERYYDIKIWDEIPSNERDGGLRLTDEIVARFPELTRRELLVHNVFCIAKRK
jgi:SAM-dependent methyltransferase